MKIKYLTLAGAVVALSSCSTAYRSGQTPDDVYYSPAPVENSYVTSVNDRDRNSYSYRNDEDEQIRRGIQNPIYRVPLNLDLGFGYGGYDPFGGYYPFGGYAYNGFGNPYYDYYSSPFGYKGLYSPYSYNYNPYGYYGYSGLGLYSPFSYYYNPYSFYGNPYYGYFNSGTINTNRGVRRYNLNPYRGSSSVSTGAAGVRNNIETTAPSTNRSSGLGRAIRRVFTPSASRSENRANNRSYNVERRSNNESNYRTFETPTRTFNNSSSTNSSSSNGSNNSNSAPVRSFRR